MDTSKDTQYPPLASGQTLGPDHHRFQLVESIGEHLFGELWQATDLSTQPTATVTLLILNPQLVADTAFVNAFKKQQTLCKSLAHPHLAACYGFFLDRSGRLFSAHEALEGLTLAQLLRQRRGRKMPPAQKRALLGQIAQALEAGYRKLRQPHGALTPAQVFINRREGVKLFGFAGLECLQQASRLLPALAQASECYLAPEAEGPGRPDARADRYSLALLAHELLAGAPPWTSPPADRDPSRLSRPGKISAQQWPLICAALSPAADGRPASTTGWVRELFSTEPRADEPDAKTATSPATQAAPAGAAGSGKGQRLGLPALGRLRRSLPAARLRGPAIFAAGLALGFWLGVWISQQQLDATRTQLLDVARRGAELRTALQAMQAEQPESPAGMAQTGPGPTATPVPNDNDNDTTASVSDAFRDELRDGGFGPEMVALPAGSFVIGSDSKLADDNERPPQRIEITHGVALARHEVTFEQYDRFADATGRPRPDDNGWGRGDQPVINVSWRDAQAYARWLSEQTGQPYRLPSEAEWEYAARAGTEGPYWWGDSLGQGHAVCDECGSDWDGRQPAPIGSFPANPWGLYDLNGNVDEWVQDCYSDSHSGIPLDGRARNAGNCELRVMRGGSWFDIGRLIRASSRYRHPPDSSRSSWGFRVAVDLQARG
ncbi:MAG: SUMF1/EgtB/PvdO family nonheme iron enzyme [Oceanospirillaceae bacterium]|nr:SUMF1/EgtB/PvdO family nonheme iron enzyme [Oceanospirillaceae bacterium]